ncbi:MAG: carboxymuconolactone decarboxylase family protein, partial [Gemmatimonadota bacterium]|nr:carboxymuconolactone decarboxylase family protein [Gemmatimonadota bacterium]
MKRFCACLLLSMLVSPVGQVIAQSRPDAPGSREPVRLTTPRIAPLPESEWTDRHRALVREYAPDGRVGNALSTLMHVPELAEAVMRFDRFLEQESALEPRHRSLLLLRTAWLTHNQYQWSVFASNGRAAGLTDAEVRRIAVGPDADGWDDFDATHLRLADELYRNSYVSDQTWTTLGVRYNLLQMMEAVANVNQSTLLAMMLNSLGVQPN